MSYPRQSPPAVRVTYLVFASVSATSPAGEWRDAAAPSFRLTANGGLSELTVRLPRRYGAMDEPNEPGTTGTLRDGYRVDVYVAGPRTLRKAPASMGTLVYSGTIEEWTADATGVDVRVVPLQRLAEQAPISSASFAGQTPGAIAQSLTSSYLPALTWDANNTTSGTGCSPEFVRVSVADALRELVRLGGAGYVWYVTGDRKLRFFKQNTGSGASRGTAATGSADHYLSVGGEVVDARLGKSSMNRVRKVIVVYQYGEYVVTGTGYDANDPRAVFVSAPEVATAADALGYGNAYLDVANQVTLKGQLTVAAERYEIESLKLGDIVRLYVPRELGTATLYAGYEDYNDKDVVIQGIDYTPERAVIEVGSAQPRIEERLRELGRQMTALKALVGDWTFARSAAGTLSSTDQFVASGGLTTIANPGIPVDGTVNTPSDGTLVLDESNDRLYIRTNGAWKYAALT